eukprot:11228325-Lingulodinium_polyedra.AAC.1
MSRKDIVVELFRSARRSQVTTSASYVGGAGVSPSRALSSVLEEWAVPALLLLPLGFLTSVLEAARLVFGAALESCLRAGAAFGATGAARGPGGSAPAGELLEALAASVPTCPAVRVPCAYIPINASAKGSDRGHGLAFAPCLPRPRRCRTPPPSRGAGISLES